MRDECPHGDDASICPPCQRTPIFKSAPDIIAMTRAKYPGRCPCQEPIYEGDLILLDDSTGDWVCEDCRP